jgi:4-diphosphocytidyl-2-C-methyl-D-erythritol kinase
VDFKLAKRIPLGAGLGGGSSNAVATLRAMNTLSDGLLSAAQLAAIAARLGSDCALFLHGGPVIMRGRGEHIEPLSDSAAARLRGQKVLLFKPSFGISTPWAYGRMAAEAPRHYLPAEEAERRLAGWSATSASVSQLLFNNMEGIAFEKFMALPVLLAKLRAEFGVEARMSGSGSACFAMTGDLRTELIDETPAGGPESRASLVTQMKQVICHCWGQEVFVQEARLV